MQVLIFSTTFSETYLILRTEPYMFKNLCWSSCKVACYACQTLMKLGFSRLDFRKIVKYQIHDNPSSGSRVVPCGGTDRHNEAMVAFFAILRKRLKMYEDITPLLHITSGVWILTKHRSKFHV